jgi:HPt (histidine-containing phosphotransfer) domain-containing protein
MPTADLDMSVVAELESLSDAEEPAFFRNQARIFSSRCRGLLHTLTEAAMSGDVGSAREAAHALAGSAAVIGAARFGELCLAIEARCERDDRDGIAAAAMEAVDAFAVVDALVRERVMKSRVVQRRAVRAH